MRTLTPEEMGDWEYTTEINGMRFFMEEAYTLPLYLVSTDGIPTKIELDEDMNGTDGDKQDEPYTLRDLS